MTCECYDLASCSIDHWLCFLPNNCGPWCSSSSSNSSGSSCGGSNTCGRPIYKQKVFWKRYINMLHSRNVGLIKSRKAA